MRHGDDWEIDCPACGLQNIGDGDCPECGATEGNRSMTSATLNARTAAHQRARILRAAGLNIFGGHPVTAPAKHALLTAAAYQEDIGNGVFS